MAVTSFNELLDIRFCGHENGVFKLELAIGAQHLHGSGGVHGGVFLTLLDTVMSRAVRASRPELSYAPTMQLTCNFFRPVNEGTIHAEGSVLNSTRKTFFAEGQLYCGRRRLLAKGSATFLVSSLEPLA